MDSFAQLLSSVKSAIRAASNVSELEAVRIQYLGKTGYLAKEAKILSQLPADQKAAAGREFNQLKQEIIQAIADRLAQLSPSAAPSFDPTFPGQHIPNGHLHPVTYAIEEISAIFTRLGFRRVRYPEVEWDHFAFTGLNMAPDHPARDDWETYFVDIPDHPQLGKAVLTPHTSSGQVRELESVSPPIRMINIAKCYRRQSDVSHTTMFHQFEGLVVDHGLNITHLKGTIDFFAQNFFGPHRISRLRPYHFQFTEPSFEVDISCGICQGTGTLPDKTPCRLCKEGWLELGGAGMVHPHVLSAAGVNPQEFTGFAFGWGVERTYMMKSGTNIADIRLLYAGDIRFLTQF